MARVQTCGGWGGVSSTRPAALNITSWFDVCLCVHFQVQNTKAIQFRRFNSISGSWGLVQCSPAWTCRRGTGLGFGRAASMPSPAVAATSRSERSTKARQDVAGVWGEYKSCSLSPFCLSVCGQESAGPRSSSTANMARARRTTTPAKSFETRESHAVIPFLIVYHSPDKPVAPATTAQLLRLDSRSPT